VREVYAHPPTIIMLLYHDQFIREELASATILHFVGIMMLLCNVTIPSRTGNLSIPCVVDGTAWTFLSLVHPMILLYEEGDRTIMKSIIAIVECSSSPNDTISDICLNG
ncbi:hypothetical protein Tco_1411507, partial [Tanacetum coccineum]